MLQTWPTALSQVVKTVYASPSRVNFQLDSKKASIFVIYHQGDRKNTVFRIHYYHFIDSNTFIDMSTGSGNYTCLSGYMLCN